MEGRIRREQDGFRLDLVLDRPDKRNAFGGTMREDLAEALEEAAGAWERGEVRVVVLRGEGGAFCAGGDVANLLRMREAGDREALSALLAKGERVTRAVRAFPGPVVAAIDGPAVGAGLTLALAADLRIASDRSRFGMAFVGIALHPDWGGSYLLAEVVGEARALELSLTGRLLDAAEAERIGLVHRVLPAEEHAHAVDRLVARLSAGPPRTQALIKRTVHGARARGFEEGFRREEEAQQAAFATEDALEGFRAFLDKRRARYEGR